MLSERTRTWYTLKAGRKVFRARKSGNISRQLMCRRCSRLDSSGADQSKPRSSMDFKRVRISLLSTLAHAESVGGRIQHTPTPLHGAYMEQQLPTQINWRNSSHSLQIRGTDLYKYTDTLVSWGIAGRVKHAWLCRRKFTRARQVSPVVPLKWESGRGRTAFIKEGDLQGWDSCSVWDQSVPVSTASAWMLHRQTAHSLCLSESGRGSLHEPYNWNKVAVKSCSANALLSHRMAAGEVASFFLLLLFKVQRDDLRAEGDNSDETVLRANLYRSWPHPLWRAKT